jgi:uncharacterized repeat protein (TIGR03943 family)
LSPDTTKEPFWRELRRWRGVLLMAIISVGTVWLAITNRLVLYIHPRYLVFTVVMSVIALAFVVGRVIVTGRHEHVDHDDEDDDPDERPLQRGLSIAALVLSVALAAGALLLPPATLSSATATQRDITAQADTSVASLDDASAADAATFARYTVLEWSSLLAQTSDPGFYAGKPADVVGFITPDPDADDVFYVSRFSITCCAVDAQPVGVPVYLPDWESQFEADAWVEVTGEFRSNRSATSSAVIALDPAEVIGVDEPSDPYLY